MFIPEFSERNVRIVSTITAVIAIASLVTAALFYFYESDSNGDAFAIMAVTFGVLTWLGDRALKTFKEED